MAPVPSHQLAMNLTGGPFKRKMVFQDPFGRFHVSWWECKWKTKQNSKPVAAIDFQSKPKDAYARNPLTASRQRCCSTSKTPANRTELLRWLALRQAKGWTFCRFNGKKIVDPQAVGGVFFGFAFRTTAKGVSSKKTSCPFVSTRSKGHLVTPKASCAHIVHAEGTHQVSLRVCPVTARRKVPAFSSVARLKGN